ncbi:hypothetical protein VPH35_052772 [Triticum aestivum]|uniref:transcription initiation factor TFIID subunit 11 isoform X1 n=1 Tax=Triticum aestivum TaxID=4565 RepID=UPI000844CDF2|nr:transcription initiation factor TFIID subunit 11-like isoform X1 [Triticum aestivum]
MKDPFEAAVEEQESPPDSPAPPEEDPATAAPNTTAEDYDGSAGAGSSRAPPPRPRPSALAAPSTSVAPAAAKAKVRPHKEQDDDDDEEDPMEVDLDKLPSGTSDPDKLAKMNALLSQFTEDQMNRYESFRRSGFQKSNMKKIQCQCIQRKGAAIGVSHPIAQSRSTSDHYRPKFLVQNKSQPPRKEHA